MVSAVSDDGPRDGPVLHLGRVDRVRIRVAYVRAPDRQAREVYLLDLPVDPTPDFDEGHYLSALEPILTPPGRPPLSYALELRRSHDTWASENGDVEIVLTLPTGATPGGQAQVVTTTLHGLLAGAGVSSSPPLGRDDGISRARSAVAATFPQTGAGRLTVTSEQHDLAANAWSVGLRSHDHEEFGVVVGWLDGWTDSAHVRHHPAGEVIDSVGLDG